MHCRFCAIRNCSLLFPESTVSNTVTTKFPTVVLADNQCNVPNAVVCGAPVALPSRFNALRGTELVVLITGTFLHLKCTPCSTKTSDLPLSKIPRNLLCALWGMSCISLSHALLTPAALKSTSTKLHVSLPCLTNRNGSLANSQHVLYA